jgi:hypothetical protein
MSSPDFTFPDITSAAHAEHRRDLHREASRAVLASVLRCCRPTAWARAARRLQTALTRDSGAPAACGC